MKRLLLLVVLLSAAVMSRAQMQEEVWTVSSMLATKVIVRAVDPDRSLIYVEYAGRSRHFVLYDHPAGLVYKHELPVYVDVKDVEVLNGWAYFCADIPLMSLAIVGQFDIMSLFFGSGQVYYTALDVVFGTMGVQVYETAKIALYDSGSKVYIYGVGKGEHHYPANPPFSCATLFHASLDMGTMQWEVCTDYQKGCEIAAFTDVAVSDNYVAVTAVDHNDTAYVLINDQLGQCDYRFKSYSLHVSVEDAKLLLTGTDKDWFVLAFQDRWVNQVTFVEFDAQNPFAVNTYETFPSGTSPYGTDVFTLTDLRYSPSTANVLLAGEMSLPPYDVFQPWVVEYRWSGAMDSWEEGNRLHWQTVDGTLWGCRFVVAGIDAYRRVVYGCKDMGQSGMDCHQMIPVLNTTPLISPTQIWTNHDNAIQYWPSRFYRGHQDSEAVKYICK
ncbi:MAG: hypothetical protein J6I49_05630 [Bacteroidales bacterium]|nr:hypothetical protein [Bacteroidales bacterium]